MKVIIQAGHKGRTSGATGAPGEQKWTSEIVPKIAQRLREKGYEVREVNADPKQSEIAGDWDLFLAVHYDADVYNDRGFFTDFPEPSTDGATEQSQHVARVLAEVYKERTGIPYHPERSNRNTRYYYMWKRLSLKTPCVIIEAGVGWRAPEDHHTLWFEQDKVSQAIAEGVDKALKGEESDPCKSVKDERDALLEENERLNKEVKKLNGRIVDLENDRKHQDAEIKKYKKKLKECAENLEKCKDKPTNDRLWDKLKKTANGAKIIWEENGKTYEINYAVNQEK